MYYYYHTVKQCDIIHIPKEMGPLTLQHVTEKQVYHYVAQLKEFVVLMHLYFSKGNVYILHRAVNFDDSC
jgi:hypothetical protein